MGERGVWLADEAGNPRGARASGLPTAAWSELYGHIISDSALPVLQRIWREQWGPEGDVHPTCSELPRLREEVASVLSAAATAESRFLLEGLTAVALQAEEEGAGLVFLAD